MLTIGLVASDEERERWREVARRLRGAVLETVVDLTADDPFAAVQAVLFPDSDPLTFPLMQHALQQRKHVLLATSPGWGTQEEELLSAAAKSAGVQFASLNPERYRPSRQLIQQQLESHLGEIGLIRLHRWEPRGERFAEGAGPTGIPASLVRDLDLVLWLARQSPQVVFALACSEPSTTADEHAETSGCSVQIHLGFASGMALIDYDSRLPEGAGYQSLSVIGSTGAATHDDHQNLQLVYRGGPAQGAVTDEGIRPWVAMTQDFVDALAQRRDLSSTISEWRKVFEVIDAVRESIATRQAVQREVH